MNLDTTTYILEELKPFLKVLKWSHLADSNRRPTVYKTVALPTELRWLITFIETQAGFYLILLYMSIFYFMLKRKHD